MSGRGSVRSSSPTVHMLSRAPVSLRTRATSASEITVAELPKAFLMKLATSAIQRSVLARIGGITSA